MEEKEIEKQPKTTRRYGWQPGQSGNPNGRPRKKTFRDYFTEEEEKDLVVHVKKEMKKRPEIAKLVVEQIFGKARQNIGIDGGEDNKPIPIMIVPNLENNVLSNNSDDEDIVDEEES